MNKTGPISTRRIGEIDFPASDKAISQSKPTHWGPASKGQRFANFILDFIGFFIFSFCLGVVLGFTLSDEAWKNFDELPDTPVGMTILFVYFFVLESVTGRTLGKWITGTKVLSTDGSPAVPWQVLGRTLCRLVPFDMFSFLGSNSKGWHDRWSGTKVVRTRAGPYGGYPEGTFPHLWDDEKQ